MNVLIGCETSAAVREQFELKGHNAWSCDLKNSAKFGNHYKGSIWDIIDNPEKVGVSHWDLGIFFPPCTHLALSGSRHFAKKIADGRQEEGIDFFLRISRTNIPKTAIENPIGIMSTLYRKPDQIIHPFHFGDTERKPTCLWLKGLPKLFWAAEDDMFATKTVVEPEIVTLGNGKKMPKFYYEASKDHMNRGGIRSKTFPGIARAMAEQWG